jgi:CHRD domain/PEP-CTERM motif
MKAPALIATTGIALLGVPVPAQAQTALTANLTNGQETTPVIPTTTTGAPRPTSFGTATFVLNATEMSFTATIFNIDVTGTQTADINDNLTNAHIHAPASPGANGGVVWGFFGAPDNDNNPDNLVFTPFASGVGGTFSSIWNVTEGNGGTTLTAQIPNILAGLSYINFHTVQFGGGEIRGQILPVPEPSTWAMMLLGFGVVGAAMRRATRRPLTNA